MDIYRIDTPFDRKGFIRHSMVRWKIHWLKFMKQTLVLAIISIVALIIGFLATNEDGSHNDFFYIGIILSVLVLLMSYKVVSSRYRYRKHIEKMAAQFDAVQMDCTYEFSDDSVKYWDKEKHVDFKWSVFTHYLIYKNFLVLEVNNSLISSYIFEKKDEAPEEYEKILEFAQHKLKYRKL